MDKPGALISRLGEQYQQGADSSSLLNTALLLVAELQNSQTSEAPQTPGKVSVIMPARPFEVIIAEDHHHEEKMQTAAQPEISVDEALNEVIENNILPEAVAEPEAEQPAPEAVSEEVYLPEPEPVQTSSVNTLAEEKYNDVLEEIPTLAQQQPKVVYELNDTMQQDEPSINDKLKQHAPEAAGNMQSEPIKDLRKAIGINDKYVFIRELFRNDEVAYERTIKTINNFSILPEAEYWIQREMKYKLGWDDNNPTVKAFYQLVKRRFS